MSPSTDAAIVDLRIRFSQLIDRGPACDPGSKQEASRLLEPFCGLQVDKPTRRNALFVRDLFEDWLGFPALDHGKRVVKLKRSLEVYTARFCDRLGETRAP